MDYIDNTFFSSIVLATAAAAVIVYYLRRLYVCLSVNQTSLSATSSVDPSPATSAMSKCHISCDGVYSSSLPLPESCITSTVGSSNYMLSLYSDCATCADIIPRGLRVAGSQAPCLGTIVTDTPVAKYVWLTYGQVCARVCRIADQLRNGPCQMSPGARLGMYCRNSSAWILVEHACYRSQLVSVPIYDTLGVEACRHILREAEIEVILVDNEEHVRYVLDAVLPDTLRVILYADCADRDGTQVLGSDGMPSLSEQVLTQMREQNVTLMPLSHLYSEPSGKDKCNGYANHDLNNSNHLNHNNTENVTNHLIPNSHSNDQRSAGNSIPNKPHVTQDVLPLDYHISPTDLATICYTSGTTGQPKGVMLTHGNIISLVSAVVFQMQPHSLHCADVMISYLPLSHTFERMCNLAMYMVGARVGFYSGNVRQLSRDLCMLQPTVLPTVPRILNRIHDQSMQAVSNSPLKRYLLQMALAYPNLPGAGLILKRVRKAFGGRIRLIVVGSAPVSPQILKFTRAAFGCHVFEGYGQTECVAPCTLTLANDLSTGHVGVPLSCCSIKLVDVPELGYFCNTKPTGDVYGEQNGAANGAVCKVGGEICVKGPTVFKGYYRNPGLTIAALDEDGWLHTGDIGLWTSCGELRIIDRKKHIFKLSQGEYVAPERLETIYLEAPSIGQIFVHGDSHKSCLVGVVVPVCDAGTDKPSTAHTQQSILAELNKVASDRSLNGFERLRAVHISHELFSVDNGLLTITMKLRRQNLLLKYNDDISCLYDNLN